MRIVAPAIAVIAAALANPALAQQASATGDNIERAIVFEGDARRACVLKAPTAASQVNATLSQSANGVNVELTPQGFIDPQTGVPRATGISLNLPITCNTAHRIRVASRNGALLRAGGGEDTGTFRSRLDFSVDVTWAGLTQSFNTANAGETILIVPDASTGAATITIAIPGGGNPLAAGAYSDTIVVEVEASS